MQPPLSGLVAAPFTPFESSGELALATIPRLASLLHKNGVNAAFVCGATGEGSNLTTEERIQVASAWRQATPADLKLAVHVGHLSLGDSRTLARHAQAIGADAIATIAPSFFKPAGAAELVAWCADIAAAAPQLPFYYYHMPAMTGVPVTATEFLRRANGRIPTLVGVKFTHEDLVDYAAARACENGRYHLLFGRDEILLSGLELGAPGAVGSTYNYAAPLYHRIMQAHAAGDLETARKLQANAQEFIGIMSRLGGLPAGKAIMKLIGVDCGPVRLPLRALHPAEESALRAGLDACGFFEYASRT
ncbi:MAG TPA: dihydrodipicolinate synthase family protein [Lacunisphaera sp.]|nr:dihydrodipicolinate synthase family protein [Lacunisphaera sp.]